MKVITNIETCFINKLELIKYFESLDGIIKNILLRPKKTILTYDILDTEKSKHFQMIALKEKQRKMKHGEIWQTVIGNYPGYINLGKGHVTGLDIISHKFKIAVELKNSFKTDNASSKKSNLDKLAIFKKKNPEYRCIYANINASSQKLTLDGSIKTIQHNAVEIEHHVGLEFLKLIYGHYTELIINTIKTTVDKYS